MLVQDYTHLRIALKQSSFSAACAVTYRRTSAPKDRHLDRRRRLCQHGERSRISSLPRSVLCRNPKTATKPPLTDRVLHTSHRQATMFCNKLYPGGLAKSSVPSGNLQKPVKPPKPSTQAKSSTSTWHISFPPSATIDIEEKKKAPASRRGFLL